MKIRLLHILVGLAGFALPTFAAIDPAFRDVEGGIRTHISPTLTMLSTDQSSVRASWVDEFSFASRMWTFKHEGTFYLTNKNGLF